MVADFPRNTQSPRSELLDRADRAVELSQSCSPQQLYWRTDIAQMTRYYMIEAARSGIRLSSRRAGFPV